jgi:hypothetical protein
MAVTSRSPMPRFRYGFVLLGILVMIAVNIATSVPASAHADHGCSGRTSSGFSCARVSTNGSTYDERLTYTYYNGSQRTFSRINFLHGRGAVTYIEACDSRKGDNIRQTIEIRDSGGGIHRYMAPSENISNTCFFYSSGFNYLAMSFRVVTYSSGQFSHATVWCAGCTPG